MENETMNKSVVKKNGSSQVAVMKSFENVATGFENMGADDLQLPRLKLLQAMSPEIETNDALKAGVILNSVTGDWWPSSQGLLAIPCHYHKNWVEWSNPDQGAKGPVAIHDSSSVLKECYRDKDDRKFYRNDNSGNYIEETANYFVLIVADDGSTSEAVMSMKSSQLTPSRNWNSKMKNLKITNSKGHFFTPPMWSHIYNIKSEKITGRNNNSWFVWKIEVDQMIQDVHLQEASSFAEKMRDVAKSLVPDQDDVKSDPQPSSDEATPF